MDSFQTIYSHTWTRSLVSTLNMATNLNSRSHQQQQQQQQQHQQHQQHQQAEARQQTPESVVPPPSQSVSHQHDSSGPPSRKSTNSTRITALQAAASDRLIARDVWTRAKDDEVRDALGRMLGWVEELVSDSEKYRYFSS